MDWPLVPYRDGAEADAHAVVVWCVEGAIGDVEGVGFVPARGVEGEVTCAHDGWYRSGVEE